VLVAGGGDDNSNHTELSSAELFDPSSGTWTITGNLTTARTSQTATLLPNGKVLVAGGAITGGQTNSAELYNPTSGTWTATGSLALARYNHTATLLPNGKVLVTGGYDGNNVFANAELYDPAIGVWTATGSLATARYGHTATLLPNGKVLVAGGINFSGDLPSAELYDPASGTWKGTGSLATARSGHTATLLPNGKVLVAGGYNRASFILASAELYDPATGTWPAKGNLNHGHLGHTATLLSDSSVLVAGSSQFDSTKSAELYHSTSPSQLLNIATRLKVQTGENVLIGGFIITGTAPKKVLIRGIGPSLSNFFTGVLADPTLELHQGSTTLATNDNWKTKPNGTSQQAEIEATTIPPTNNLESAILATLNPGAYTAILAGKDGGTGIGVVEVYDLDQTANSKLANISTRGFVDTGNNVLIGGLIVGGGSGGGTAKVIARALGPSVPVAGAMPDPTLELHNGSGTTIATNDNWKKRPDGSSQQAEIEATTIPPTKDLESALVATLAPGNYTAIVRGKDNTTGIAVVEVYNLQ
jgi:WD40 repeat protein